MEWRGGGRFPDNVACAIYLPPSALLSPTPRFTAGYRLFLCQQAYPWPVLHSPYLTRTNGCFSRGPPHLPVPLKWAHDISYELYSVHQPPHPHRMARSPSALPTPTPSKPNHQGAQWGFRGVGDSRVAIKSNYNDTLKTRVFKSHKHTSLLCFSKLKDASRKALCKHDIFPGCKPEITHIIYVHAILFLVKVKHEWKNRTLISINTMTETLITVSAMHVICNRFLPKACLKRK